MPFHGADVRFPAALPAWGVFVFLAVGCAPKTPLPSEVAPAWTHKSPVTVHEAPSEAGPEKGEADGPSSARPAKGSPRRLTRVPVEVLPDGRRVQRVWIWQETGDCLWNMAREFYGNPYLWPRIYDANRDVIKNPGVIFPKQVIVIPPLEDVEGR